MIDPSLEKILSKLRRRGYLGIVIGALYFFYAGLLFYYFPHPSLWYFVIGFCIYSGFRISEQGHKLLDFVQTVKLYHQVDQKLMSEVRRGGDLDGNKKEASQEKAGT